MSTPGHHDLVGRDADLAALDGLIAGGRAVTLTGPGGVGKTTLANAVADRMRRRGRRVGMIELASVTGADRLAQAIGTSLGIRAVPLDDAAAMIVDWAHGEPALLVLDNCEHLGDAPARLVIDTLARAPHVAVLATSREPLRRSGEQLYDVRPLSTTDGEVPAAAQLFVDRARLVSPGLQPTEAQWRSIRDITSRLDGMPLAIEMAASRTRSVDLVALADAVRLDLSLLTLDGVDVPTRQRTMHACIDASFGQLDQVQRQAMGSLSTFEGGFRLADARAVLDPSASSSHIIAVLGGLVDRSLIQRDEDAADTGYRMLHVVRAFAREHIDDESSAIARRRHMEHFAALCDDGRAGLETNRQSHWLATLSRHASDIDSAMCFAAANDEASTLWQMCGSLTFVWVAAGRFTEGAQWFAECCEHLDIPITVQLPARWGAAHLAVYSGDVERAFTLADETLAMARQIGDRSFVARCENALGVGGMFNQRRRAREVLRSSIEGSVGLDDWCHVDSSQVLAYIDLQELRVDDAVRRLASVRPLVEHLRHPPLLAWDWLGRYQAAAIRGDVVEAGVLERQTVEHVAAAGDTSISALLVAARSQVAQRAGRAADTLVDLERALDRCVAQGAHTAALTLLGASIDARLCIGDFGRARQLLDDVEGQVEQHAPDVAMTLHLQRCRWALAVGDAEVAESSAALAQRVAQRHETAPGLAVVQCWNAFIATSASQPTVAWRSAIAAWSVLRADRLDAHAIGCLRVMALCCAAFEDRTGAMRVIGAADAFARRIGVVDEPCGSLFAAALADLTSVDDVDLIAARTLGEGLDPDAAFASVARSTGPRRRPSSGWDGLTPAERQVATLVAEGLTNRQTAERLFIGAGTVKTHLEHAYAKIGVRNRTELTAAFHREHRS